MKKLVKLVLVLAVVMFTTNTFAEELGLKISNLNLAPAAKEKKKSSNAGSLNWEMLLLRMVTRLLFMCQRVFGVIGRGILKVRLGK